MSPSFKDGFKAYLGVMAAKALISFVSLSILFLVLGITSYLLNK